MGRMDGKIAVVTGAGGGICAAVAKMFAREGAKVVLVDRKEAVFDQAREIGDNGGEAVALQLDVGVKENWETIFSTVMDRFGGCNTVVNGAADFSLSGDWDAGKEGYLENWDVVFKSNVMAMVYSYLTFMPHFQESEEQCAFFNFSSVTAFTYAGAACQAYPSSKAVIKLITQDMAAKHSKDGVRFNCCAPNNIYTPENDFIYTHYHDKFIADTPLGCLGDVDDVAYLAVFLCSDESRFITGVCVPIDGGFLTCH